MAYPNATIYWFSDAGIAPIQYAQTEHYKTTKAFLDNPRRMLIELMKTG